MLEHRCFDLTRRSSAYAGLHRQQWYRQGRIVWATVTLAADKRNKVRKYTGRVITQHRRSHLPKWYYIQLPWARRRSEKIMAKSYTVHKEWMFVPTTGQWALNTHIGNTTRMFKPVDILQLQFETVRHIKTEWTSMGSIRVISRLQLQFNQSRGSASRMEWINKDSISCHQ
jgi:hypothetical protein